MHLRHCEENGCGEGETSVQDTEQPGENVDVSLHNNDVCLHRPHYPLLYRKA